MSTPQFPIQQNANAAADAGPEQSAENPAATIGREKSLYLHKDGLAPLPTAEDVAASELNTADIQADIFGGMQKLKQLFYFFSIHDAARFKRHLASDFAPVVASVKRISDVRTQPFVALNIAFSHAGLNALGVTDDLNDDVFKGGQFADAIKNFNDEKQNWVPQFVGDAVHGVILLASDSTHHIERQVACIERAFGPSMSKVYTLDAAVRPGSEAGHEMFGFLDGIAQPAIAQLHKKPLPGQSVVDAGVIITGATGDGVPRPAWAVGGSFLAFRQLEQRVPEFNQYLLDNAPAGKGSLQSRADLLGARMVGRWKSGAPVDLAPTADDPDLGKDAQRNNNFTYEHAGFDLSSDQSHCPFSAHIRKTRPRADFKGLTILGKPADEKVNSIMRSGIPYGPEVTPEEAAAGTTNPELQRGLAFVAYQAQLKNGFQFLQQSWADNATFPPKKNPPVVGLDPIIGQAAGGGDRLVAGLNPNNTNDTLSMIPFVISRGGEYFFSPPISALRGPLGTLEDASPYHGGPPHHGEPPHHGGPPHGGPPHGGPPHGGPPHFGGPPHGGPPQHGGAAHGGASHHEEPPIHPYNHGH